MVGIMRFSVVFILVILLGYLVYVFNDFLPWWAVGPAAFLASASVKLKPWQSWVAGFGGLFLLWAILSFSIDQQNGSLLSKRMAEVLPLKGSQQLAILATALVGGFIGGFCALAASYLRPAKPKL
jgi:hypothetical protein